MVDIPAAFGQRAFAEHFGELRNLGIVAVAEERLEEDEITFERGVRFKLRAPPTLRILVIDEPVARRGNGAFDGGGVRSGGCVARLLKSRGEKDSRFRRGQRVVDVDQAVEFVLLGVVFAVTHFQGFRFRSHKSAIPILWISQLCIRLIGGYSGNKIIIILPKSVHCHAFTGPTVKQNCARPIVRSGCMVSLLHPNLELN